MPELVPNRFPATVAFDANTSRPLENAQADVYAVTDTGFTNPLPLKHISGLLMTKLVSSSNGIFPAFDVDTVEEHVEVVAKSGSYTTPLVSFVGGRGPAGDKGDAGPGVDPAGSAPGQVLTSAGEFSDPVWATPPAAAASTWDAITAKPNVFPPTGHTHSTTDIANASNLGRAFLSAADAASARAMIGAGTGSGTSNLALGSSGTTAAPGNHSHSAAQIPFAASGWTASNVQAGLVEVNARKIGSPNGSVSGFEHHPNVASLPPVGVAGVIYFTDAE